VLLSVLLCYWVNDAGKRGLNWSLGILYGIAIALPLIGLVAQKH
jgi:hypothetical protein